MRYLLYIVTIIALGGGVKGCNGGSAIDYKKLHIEENHTYTIRDNIDLRGQTVEMPAGVKLVAKGGLICNGTIVGNNTIIIGKKPLFNHITIKGTWNVPNISTKLFKDLNYENSLQDLLALTSSNIKNTVYIQKGSYKVNVKSGGAGITLKSNTVLELEGDIELVPNSFDICYVVLVKDVSNVTIKGGGTLIGDKYKHICNNGEWGMGIQILGGKNIDISGITIKNCWGDCIYIGQESEDVRINGCTLDNGRRQGVSITSAKNVDIANCLISNIYGTSPEFAIDIEPNKFDVVKQVSITNVQIQDCGGGIAIYGDARGALVKDVSIKNCIVAGSITRIPYSFSSAERVKIQKCKSNAHVQRSLYAKGINGLQLQDNNLSATTNEVVTIDNCIDVEQNHNKLVLIK